MDLQHWWDNVAARRDRAQALRIVGLSPKLAPLPWEKLTQTAQTWLTGLLVVSDIGDEESRSASGVSPRAGQEGID